MTLHAEAFQGIVRDGALCNREGVALLTDVLAQIEGAEVMLLLVVVAEPKIAAPSIAQWEATCE